jgi:hypothetical protein
MRAISKFVELAFLEPTIEMDGLVGIVPRL